MFHAAEGGAGSELGAPAQCCHAKWSGWISLRPSALMGSPQPGCCEMFKCVLPSSQQRALHQDVPCITHTRPLLFFPPPAPFPHLLSFCSLARLNICFPNVQWEKGTMGFFFLVAGWFFLFVFFTLPVGKGWGKSKQACSNSAASSISPSGSLPGDAGGICELPLDYSRCPWNCWVRRKGAVQEEVNDEQITKP